jgi:hypothetical protein
MEWLLVVGVVAAVWYSLRNSNQKEARGRQGANADAVQTTAAVRIGSSIVVEDLRSDQPEVDVGDMVPAGDNAWVLNPRSPLPLTLLNAEKNVAIEVRGVLSSREYWVNKVPELAMLIAQHNLRFKEVDELILNTKPRFDAEIGKLIQNSAEWSNSSDKDRQDLRNEFEALALNSLGIWAGQVDLVILLSGQPSSFTDDDELLRQFHGDVSLYSLYLSLLGRGNSVTTVKADDYQRKQWEKLVEIGLARRGKDIPIPQILDGLRLKDINVILADAIPKPLGRKSNAVEVASALPDIDERLSKHVSFREMFQVMKPADTDIEAIVNSFAYSNQLAAIVQQTYYTGLLTLEAKQERKQDDGFYNAWEISNWEDPLPSCAASVCRKYAKLPSKLPPFHVGCSCRLECAHEK